MTTKSVRRAAFAVAVMLAGAGAAHAQTGPITAAFSGGPSFPVGEEFTQEAGTGYHVQFSLGFAPALLPVGVRADLLWQEFPDEAGGHFRGVGGLANAIVGLPLGIARPYLIGGAGVLNLSTPGASHGGHTHAEGNETGFAFGLGGGIEFPFLGLTGALEARYLDAGEEHRGVPVSFSVRF